MHDENLYAERAFRAGANGYITKRQPAEEVVTAIRRVLAGDVYLSEKMTAGVLRSLPGTGIKNIPGPSTASPTASWKSWNSSGAARRRAKSPAPLELGVATIDTYRARIKEKMNFRNAVELQHFAIRWHRERE